MVTLDIISDPICPWCYIGKTRLDRALGEAGHNPFSPRWRMFRLNPDMPAEGMDRRAYLEAKFGGPEGADRVYGAIQQAAEADGLDVNLSSIQRTPQTLDAHRVIRWASEAGVAEDVTNILFDRYFRLGEDISDRDLLLEVAGAVGMDRDVVARLLQGDADREALIEEEQAAREMGVTGVPCFIIQGRYVVQGAQDSPTWLRVIDEISTAASEQNSAAGPEREPEAADGAAPRNGNGGMP
ncbi:MAG: DsbA family oxidoreductase [Pseudomonadota bacterium]